MCPALEEGIILTPTKITITNQAPVAVIQQALEPTFEAPPNVIVSVLPITPEELIIKALDESREAEIKFDRLILEAETALEQQTYVDPILMARIDIAEIDKAVKVDVLEQMEIKTGLDAIVVEDIYQAQVKQTLVDIKARAPEPIYTSNPLRQFTDFIGKVFYDTFSNPTRTANILGGFLGDVAGDIAGFAGDIGGSFFKGLFPEINLTKIIMIIIAVVIVLIVVLVSIFTVKTFIKQKVIKKISD